MKNKEIDVEMMIEKTKQILTKRKKCKNEDIVVLYIVSDYKNKKDVGVVADIDEYIFEVNPYSRKIIDIPPHFFNFDAIFFKDLEENRKINYITPSTHYNIWCMLEEWYPKYIENRKGMMEYLKYCKENNITKEFIDKEVKLDVPNMMTIYKKEKNKERTR